MIGSKILIFSLISNQFAVFVQESVARESESIGSDLQSLGEYELINYELKHKHFLS